MADINITVDSNQVKSAKQDIQELGNSFNSASKSASIFMQAFERAAKQSQRDEQYIRQTSQALKRLIDDNLKITNSYKSAQDSASAFTEQLRVQEAQALRTARANQEAFNKQLGVGGVSATASGAGFGAIEAEMDRLATKYNSVYSASRLYEQQLNELNRANQLGVVSVKQYEAQLEQLNLEYQQFANAAEGAYIANNRFTQHVNQSGRGLNNFGLYAQQVGYQVGDFFVQVQSGTNALVAFGQQATQLAGLIPGVLGAALGIGISLVTAIGAAFMRTREESDKGASSIKNYADSISALTEEINRNQEAFLKVKFGTEIGAVATASQQIQDLREQIPIVKAELDAFYLAAAQGGGISLGALFGDEGTRLEKTLKDLQDKLALLEKQRKAQDINNQMLAVEIGHARAIGDQVRANTAAWKAQFDMIRASIDGINGLKMAVTLQINTVMSAAQRLPEWASGIYGKMREMAWQGGLAGNATAMAGAPRAPAMLGEEFLGGGSSGTSGGGGGNPALDSLINQLQTEREILDEWYVESQETLKSASESELQIIGGYNEAKLRLAQEYQDKLAAINGQGNKSQLETFLSGTGEILGAMGAFNDKALRISKAFAAAEALVSTYQGAAAELKKGVFGFATAAAVIAKGLGFVAAIRGISSSGGGSVGGGGRGSATVPAAAQAATPQTVFIDSIDPDNLYSGQSLINLFEAFYDENDRRGKVFVVAR